ncbi:MAG: hypothetical protein Q7K40_00215 [bacterium]|nr:hypothetical protein [bacterium]
MKKIIFIIIGIILVAVLGRLGWAYFQLKSDFARTASTEALLATTTNEPTLLIPQNKTAVSTSTVAPTFQTSITRSAGIKINTTDSVDLCVGKDGIGTVAPLNQAKVITDPETGTKIVSDQILMIFKNGTLRSTVNAKINSINGVMVGCLADMDKYQVRIGGNLSLNQMKTLVNLLNKDSLIDSASLNTISSLN